MTTQPFQLDPDVEHILQEVAKDPRSSLLRVERPKIIRGLTEREPSVGVATAGLTTAERHLVQTRRAETAYALRALCLQAILSDPRGTNVLSRQTAATQTQLSLLLSNLRANWFVNERDHTLELGHDAIFARDAVAGRIDSGCDVFKLAAVAHRLEPGTISRLYVINWLQLGSQHRSAIGLLRNAMTVPESSLLTAVLGTNLGFAYYRLGLFYEALNAYRQASLHQRAYIPASVGSLLVALQLGAADDASRAGVILDECNRPDSEEITWQCRAEGTRRAQFQEHLSEPGRELILRLRDRLGPTSRLLINAVG